MPNINDAFPSNYLKASDLRGSEVVVTIDHVGFEPVGRQKEMKAVVYFKGKEKGLVLNKTNATKITQLAGSPNTEDWDGIKVKLYPTETEFAGEMTECIRIKAAPAVAAVRQAAPVAARAAAPPRPQAAAAAVAEREPGDEGGAPEHGPTDDDIPF
jgi:hypothetical protein